MSNWVQHLVLPAMAVTASCAWGTVYHDVESAQKACFPAGAEFVAADVQLGTEQMKAIEKASGVRVRLAVLKAWKVSRKGVFEGWFLVDEVLGKHEFITYALALEPSGAVRSIEVMEYRENYGQQVRNADWRAQFLGLKHGAPLRLTGDIRNISGATLSCRHLTEGVKRLLATHDLLLRR